MYKIIKEQSLLIKEKNARQNDENAEKMNMHFSGNIN